MTAVTRGRIRDFGFDPNESPYHFVVHLRPGEDGGATVEERFNFDSTLDDAQREPVVKALLDQYRWIRIEGTARAEFNQRLVALGFRPASWHARDTLLAPHLGKELTLLAWAVEDADPTVIPNVIANWLGLAPEERWWLYTTVNATSGHPEHGRDRGWRKAIKIAFAENPASAVSPGTIWISEGEAKRPESDRPSRARRHRPKRDGPEQLALLEGMPK